MAPLSSSWSGPTGTALENNTNNITSLLKTHESPFVTILRITILRITILRITILRITVTTTQNGQHHMMTYTSVAKSAETDLL